MASDISPYKTPLYIGETERREEEEWDRELWLSYPRAGLNVDKPEPGVQVKRYHEWLSSPQLRGTDLLSFEDGDVPNSLLRQVELLNVEERQEIGYDNKSLFIGKNTLESVHESRRDNRGAGEEPHRWRNPSLYFHPF